MRGNRMSRATRVKV